MKRSILVVALFLLSLCFSLFANSLSAAVIERDWKSPDDGLLTYDTINNREWLDLSQTLLQQFPGAAIEDQFQSVVAGLAPNGGEFTGFSEAKNADVIALAESARIDLSTTEFVINDASTDELVELLGATETLCWRLPENCH